MYEKDESKSRCVVGYTDLDFTSDIDNRRSITRYVFTMYGNLVSYKNIL